MTPIFTTKNIIIIEVVDLVVWGSHCLVNRDPHPQATYQAHIYALSTPPLGASTNHMYALCTQIQPSVFRPMVVTTNYLGVVWMFN